MLVTNSNACGSDIPSGEHWEAGVVFDEGGGFFREYEFEVLLAGGFRGEGVGV